jgi:hypothetical protein
VADETTFKYTADFSQIKKEIDELTAKIGKLESSLDRTAKKFGDKSPQANMVRNAFDRTMAEMDKKVAQLEKLNNQKPGSGSDDGGSKPRGATDRELENRYKRESLKYYRDFNSAFGKSASSMGRLVGGGFGGLATGQGISGFTRELGSISRLLMASGTKQIFGGLAQGAIMGGMSKGAVGSAVRKGAGGAAVAGEEAETAGAVEEAVSVGAGMGILKAFTALPGYAKLLIGGVVGLTAAGAAAVTFSAKDVYARGRRAGGFGTSVGLMSGFEDTMDRFVDPDTVLKSMQQAKFDITSPAYTAMRIGGLDPSKYNDPAMLARANIVSAQTELKKMYAQNPQTLLTMAHARGFQHRGLSDEDIMRLAQGDQSEVNKLIRKSVDVAPSLDITEKQRQAYDDLITETTLLGERFKTAGEDLSEHLIDPAKKLVEMLDKINVGMDNFNKWINKIIGVDPDKVSENGSAVSMEVGGAGGGFRIPGESRGSSHGGPNVAGGFSGFGGKAPGAPVSNARTGVAMKAAIEQLREEGVPEDHLKAAAAILVGEAQSESSLNPDAKHDPHNGVYTGYGIYGARDPPDGRGVMRRQRMLAWLKAHGYASDSLEGQVKEMAHSAMHDFPSVAKILKRTTPGSMLDDTYGVTKDFESPAVVNDRRGAVRGAFDKGPAADDKSASGKQSMNNMSHFQGNNKQFAIRIDNPAGANYAVSGGMLGVTQGNYGNG